MADGSPKWVLVRRDAALPWLLDHGWVWLCAGMPPYRLRNRHGVLFRFKRDGRGVHLARLSAEEIAGMRRKSMNGERDGLPRSSGKDEGGSAGTLRPTSGGAE